MSIDVLVAGTVFTDMVFSGTPLPSPGTEVLSTGFCLSPGGAANRAVAAARLGARTGLLASFGDDQLGHMVLEELRNEPNLDLSACEVGSVRQTPISVAITDGKDRSFVTYWEREYVPAWHRNTESVSTVHVGLQDTIPQWARDLRNKGALLIGGVGWDASGEWSPSVLKRFEQVDAVIVNDVEAKHYTGANHVEDALEIMLRHVSMAVVTLGPKGAIGQRREEAAIYVPAIPVHAVDPTGAGDTFTAAFMCGLAWQWNFRNCLELASLAATCSVCGTGGAVSTPRPSDIVQLLESPRQQDHDWSFIRQWALNY